MAELHEFFKDEIGEDADPPVAYLVEVLDGATAVGTGVTVQELYGNRHTYEDVGWNVSGSEYPKPGDRGVLLITDAGTPWLVSYSGRANLTTLSPLAHGAIGDGQSHLLSERFPTLAAAQRVYPHAVALTDEIDWCAWQAALDEAEQLITDGLAVSITIDGHNGYYFINRWLRPRNGYRIVMVKGALKATVAFAGPMIKGRNPYGTFNTNILTDPTGWKVDLTLRGPGYTPKGQPTLGVGPGQAGDGSLTGGAACPTSGVELERYCEVGENFRCEGFHWARIYYGNHQTANGIVRNCYAGDVWPCIPGTLLTQAVAIGDDVIHLKEWDPWWDILYPGDEPIPLWVNSGAAEEYMLITGGKQTRTPTVLRGQNGTTEKAHSALVAVDDPMARGRQFGHQAIRGHCYRMAMACDITYDRNGWVDVTYEVKQFGYVPHVHMRWECPRGGTWKLASKVVSGNHESLGLGAIHAVDANSSVDILGCLYEQDDTSTGPTGPDATAPARGFQQAYRIPDQNEIRSLIVENATGGSLTLRILDQPTASITPGMTAADVQAIVEALSTVGAGNVICGGGPVGTAPVTMEFTGALAAESIGLISLTNLLTGGNDLIAKVSLVQPGLNQHYNVQAGSFAGMRVRGALPFAVPGTKGVMRSKVFADFQIDLDEIIDWQADPGGDPSYGVDRPIFSLFYANATTDWKSAIVRSHGNEYRVAKCQAPITKGDWLQHDATTPERYVAVSTGKSPPAGVACETVPAATSTAPGVLIVGTNGDFYVKTNTAVTIGDELIMNIGAAGCIKTSGNPWSGTGTIPAGTTQSALINHNFGSTPSSFNFSLTRTNKPGGAPGGLSVSNISSTQFRVNSDAAPTADLTFGWRVEPEREAVGQALETVAGAGLVYSRIWTK